VPFVSAMAQPRLAYHILENTQRDRPLRWGGRVPVKQKIRPVGELAVLSVLIASGWAVFGVRSVV
jgi:hypothetical protein